MRLYNPWRIFIALLASFALLAGGLFFAPKNASAAGVDEDTGQSQTLDLEHRQLELDSKGQNELVSPTPDSSSTGSGESTSMNNGENVQGFAQSSRLNTFSRSISKIPYDLRVDLLPETYSANRSSLTFSWKNAVQARQQSYEISVFQRQGSTDAVYRSDELSGTSPTSVHLDNLTDRLTDNSLYYWQVQVTYADGTIESSQRSPFATSVGESFASTNFLWTQDVSVANLARAKVQKGAGVEKALLTVTALDTEVARRHVFNAYVNGTEVGVGPTRRSGSDLYYNTYDISDYLSQTEDNVIGLFSYSQAHDSGILMQLTYFYADGSQQIVYNSGRDSSSTQIMKMDDVVYGTSGQSIGTEYYTELSQNADVGRYPFEWYQVGNFNEAAVSAGSADSKQWKSPKSIPLAGFSNEYHLVPSIVRNMTRRLVNPTSVECVGSGKYTISFPRELIGDIQLSVSASSETRIGIEEGEELENGVAKYKLRTGNVYKEAWTFPATRLFPNNHVTFTGFSLRGFRYVTVDNYPGTLHAEDIRGVESTLPDDTSGSFSSNVDLSNQIYELASYSRSQADLGTVVDSVTRERRPYEGDTLIYQALDYQDSDDYTTVRNTWNWLMMNPSQYTEYRLMTVIGVYQDYLHTADSEYVSQVYLNLQKLLGVVKFNDKIGLVTNSGDTVDLVDWPRTEVEGYDFNGTCYKTVVNAVAAEAYRDMSELATITNHMGDQKKYLDYANTVRQSMISRLYSPTTHSFRDGLTSSANPVDHYIPQNNFFALFYRIYTDQKMADSLAERMTRLGAQSAGSIYSAYFFYGGLAKTNNADRAYPILNSQSPYDIRTYYHVLNQLGATITPEAWDPSSKANMTFSHVWGSGGGIGLIDGIMGMTFSQSDNVPSGITIQADGYDTINSRIPTILGNINLQVSRVGQSLEISLSAPCDLIVTIPRVSAASKIDVDGATAADSHISDGILTFSLESGAHSIHVAQMSTTGWANDIENGRDTLAVRRGNTYYFKNSVSGGDADSVVSYGRASDVVLVGDWGQKKD